MGKVSLEGLEFFAYHGFYEEERKIGNRYSVDVVVHTDFETGARNDVLEGTVNYELLYKIVAQEMEISSKLLEHVGKRVIDRVFKTFASACKVIVTIYKHNPPIGGICRFAKVELEQNREDASSEVEELISKGEEFGLPKAPLTDEQLRITEDFFNLPSSGFDE